MKNEKINIKFLLWFSFLSDSLCCFTKNDYVSSSSVHILYHYDELTKWKFQKNFPRLFWNSLLCNLVYNLLETFIKIFDDSAVTKICWKFLNSIKTKVKTQSVMSPAKWSTTKPRWRFHKFNLNLIIHTVFFKISKTI